MDKLQIFLKYKTPFSGYWYRYHNPYYYWWKVKKYFKKPICHFSCGKVKWFFGHKPKNGLNKVLDIDLSALGWKSKYDSPRHEWDPYISIVFFRKWELLWIFNWVSKEDRLSDTRSMATWEAILDILYFNRSLDWVKKHHVWETTNREKIKINPNLHKKFQ